MNRKQKQAHKLLKAIEFEAAPLSTNKGRFVFDPRSRVLTKKDRKHSGHRTVYVEDEGGYVTQFDGYNDRLNYRDSMRNKWAIKKIKNIYPGMFYCDEERYWDLREKINKIIIKEKMRKIRKSVSSVNSDSTFLSEGPDETTNKI